MGKILARTFKCRVLCSFAAAAVTLALAPQALATGIVSLQNYYNIGVLGLVNASIVNENTDTQTTSEAVAWNGTTGGTVTESAGTKITNTGAVYYNGAPQPLPSDCGSGCVADPSDLNTNTAGNLVNNAMSAVTAAEGNSVTDALGAYNLGVSDAQTIDATTGINVLSASTFELHTNAVLTLNGTASQYFIFLISSTFTLNSNSAIQLSGGLLASHVLYVFTGDGAANVMNQGATINGTLLSTGTDTFNLNGSGNPVTVNGMVITNANTQLWDVDVNSAGNTFVGTVPEPGTWIMLGDGLLGLGFFQFYRRKRKPGASRWVSPETRLGA
jgi:hypothetical protein